MKQFLRDFGVSAASGLAVAIVTIWVFDPETFFAGIKNLRLELVIKVLLVIFIGSAWVYASIYLRTRQLVGDISNLHKANITLSVRIDELEDKVRHKIGDHFYTIDEKERIEAIQKHRYADEDICCYVFPVKPATPVAGTVPLYRLFRY